MASRPKARAMGLAATSFFWEKTVGAISQPKIRPPTRPPMWAVLLTFGIVAPKKRLMAVRTRSWLMIGLRVEKVPRLIAKPNTPPKRPKIAPDAPTAGAVKEPKY